MAEPPAAGAGKKGGTSMRDALEKAGAEAKSDSIPAPSPSPPPAAAPPADPEAPAAAREIQVVSQGGYTGGRRDPAAAEDESYVVPEEPPSGIELVGWYGYGFCSYFISLFLLPVLFPTIITQVKSPAPDSFPDSGPGGCSAREIDLYNRLTDHSIQIGSSNLSPLNWAALSWAIGIVISAPILTQAPHHLDRGQHQAIILIAATSFGSFFCLLTGFFKTEWIFPFYIIFVSVGIVVAEAAYTRNLGLLIRGLSANTAGKHLILRRRTSASELSLYATAAGGVGAALMAAFTYHMLRRTDQFTGLWVVSIFCGLIWFVGICQGCFSNRPGAAAHTLPYEPTFFTKLNHALTLVRYPQAIGSLISVFLASFATMLIFTSAVLYVISPSSCITPVLVLALWILYFMFPLISLPILHPIQLFIRADAVRMQLFGFFISLFISGAGFYYKNHHWTAANVIVVGLVQSTATGVLHAFGRVLLLDSSPPGKEGVFSSWYAIVRATGLCIGFAIASSNPGSVAGSFAAAFLGSFLGIIVLIFGNVSNIGALVGAGHLKAPEEGLEAVAHEKVGGEGMTREGGDGRARA